ncbi:AsnC family transcriptional regulator [Thauera sp. CAU 1555]|uniref:siroheme decarboxylase n=1 Tax=Thauera sedimentorum TaxID=2767595 RepID=A0ABR9B6A4_9RHOO|nr:AsnC family transcriptional regulator [Thauera sedimentorum]MBC9070966.1 AsnC family transcriptional regulator [Thauera sedimentorum]MBD8501885.1 AsnC family transcriptional regulator [Thauera sedimentorum]
MSEGLPPPRDPIDEIDRRLINSLQGDFPLSHRPYGVVAERLGLGEEEVIRRLRRLLADRVLTRFGPMFQIERAGGAFCLAAMEVPEARWPNVVAQVNLRPEVAHNYRREHRLNMWFVLATETPEGIGRCAGEIERDTGLAVHLFPKEREYFVEMKLEAR